MLTVEARRKEMTRSQAATLSGGLGLDPVTITALVTVGIKLLPGLIDLVKGWFNKNPQAPTPQQIAAPINQGQYQDKDSVEAYLSGKLSAYPADVRPGIALGIWANIQNKTPEIALGFRKAARQYPDLKDLVKQDAFGARTFMEKFGLALIITGAVVGVGVTGLVVYKVVKRRRG